MRPDLFGAGRRIARRLRLLPAERYAFPVPPAPDLTCRDRDLARPPAERGYVIHFTPRSGSSWLGDLARRSGRLGRPGEMFNPDFMPRIAQALNATTLDEYCALLPRRKAHGRVWGFEITHHQLRAVFGSDEAFLARFGHLPAVFLIRRDIVAQGVSLAKMSATRVTHSISADAAGIRSADARLVYDAQEIRRWIRHVRTAERGTEALLARAGAPVLRMSYEENVAHPPIHLLKLLARQAGLPGPLRVAPAALQSAHVKIGTGLNESFASRFRAEEAEWVAALEAERRPLLDQIAPYGPRARPRRRPGP